MMVFANDILLVIIEPESDTVKEIFLIAGGFHPKMPEPHHQNYEGCHGAYRAEQ